ncbi:MAG: lytic murein transglycosylase [Candidatus Magasanikbacteria bacterium]|nr:lytic murein transglycosylase [Candidatus Magasanikbacteria bacterium]
MQDVFKLRIFRGTFVAGIVCVFVITGIFGYTRRAQADTASEKAQLEQELQQIEDQIKQYEGELATTQTQKKTLQNKIAGLKKQRDKLGLQIKATTLKLKDVSNKLVVTEKKVDETAQKIDQHRALLAQLIKQVHESDQITFLDTMLIANTLSDFFLEIDQLDQLQIGLRDVLKNTKELKKELDDKAGQLQDQKTSVGNLLSIQSLQQQAVDQSKREQDTLLKETGGREKQYQQVLSDVRKRAAEIRSRIYELVGVSKQINFGEAVSLAQWASNLTGVRPAFLLAIIKQESNLGRNVGTCNRPGDPPEKSWRVVMKPERDQPLFKQITEELGLDPDTMPVSCPMTRNGKKIGWGGAMGPAQFIPSTWIRHRNEVTAITGQATANPWDTRDAFIASAILLKSNGAAAQTKDAEWRAAMRYFSGGTNPAFRFYGDNVMTITKGFQEDIDNLNAAK